jgi:mannitol/fructose-specific phosphotransferase system IIA component (Ntr-type)
MEASKKKQAIEELVKMLCDKQKIPEIKPIVDNLLAREKQISSGIGEGIAIPHDLSITGLDATYMAFGRKQSGIDFCSMDNRPVTLIFLILGPEVYRKDHLQILCKLTRILHDPMFRETLHEVKKQEDIIEAIKKQEQK